MAQIFETVVFAIILLMSPEWSVGQGRVIDLGGQRLEVSRITVSPSQGPVEYRNGTIAFGKPDGS